VNFVLVRSKICEYLYRYEPKVFNRLTERNHDEQLYEMSVLDSQWSVIQSNPK
jgi:hypothetical protein